METKLTRKARTKKSLEQLHRDVLLIGDHRAWLVEGSLEQPTLVESVDSVGTPGTLVDSAFVEGTLLRDAGLGGRITGTPKD